ncbi:MAG: plasmid pRiA4b ORF-3 family protein [Ilumatobacteraceae bacterium]
MLVLRGTKKLRDRIKGPAAKTDDVSTTVLGDWFATALFWKPQVALLVNQRTLLPVFMPLAPAATLVARVPEAIATALRNQGASEAFIAAELAAMGEVRIATTNDRSTVGVMNEFAFHGELHVQEGLTDLEALSYRLSSLILGPLHQRHGSPDHELAALLRSGPSNVIELRPRAAPPTIRHAGNQAHLFQLKVTLLGIKPPVWRRIVVYASTPLDRLHEYIQAAFGWWNYHLYEFEIDRKHYGIPDPDWDYGPPVKNAHRTKLGNIADVGDSFKYTYDFGDSWEHKITIEKSIPITPGIVVPACTDGRRTCPPEDCGGPWGYEQLLKILADPSHPEHEERVMWAGGWGGGKLDPDAFDPSEFNDNLDALRQTTFD